MQVDDAIRSRRTVKVFADPDMPPDVPEGLFMDVREAVEAAGWAPFHRPCSKGWRDETSGLTSPVPWRMHCLEHQSCRTLIERLRSLSEDAEGGPLASVMNSKVPSMLAAAGAVVLVTWLPHPDRGAKATDRTINEEHLMAAAAATQNLLLSLTAAGHRTYWSSGGALREPAVFETLGINPAEEFVGAVFVWPPEARGEESVPGKQRENRGEPSGWSRVVTLR